MLMDANNDNQLLEMLEHVSSSRVQWNFKKAVAVEEMIFFWATQRCPFNPQNTPNAIVVQNSPALFSALPKYTCCISSAASKGRWKQIHIWLCNITTFLKQSKEDGNKYFPFLQIWGTTMGKRHYLRNVIDLPSTPSLSFLAMSFLTLSS